MNSVSVVGAIAMNQHLKVLRNLLVIVFGSYASCGLYAQGTAFTYQGALNNGGVVANGTYDFAFSLYATNTNGFPVAGPVTNSATPVTNGIFITSIDFGAVIFNGSNCWLEVSVRSNATPTFTILTPRQQLTPTPYAILAATANYLNGPLGWSNVTGEPTTLAGYGITNAQQTNANLTALSTNNGSNLTNLPAPNLVGNIPTTTLINSGAVTTTGNNQNISQTPVFQNGFVAQNLGSPYYEANTPYFGSSATPILWAGGNPNLTNAGMNPQVNIGTPNVWGSGAGLNWLFPMLCNLTNNGQFYCVFTNYFGLVTTNGLTPVITNVNGIIVGYNIDFSPSMNLNGPFGVQGDSPDAIEIINNGNLLTKISTVGAVQDVAYVNGQVVSLPNGSTFTYQNGITGNYPFFIADPVGFYSHPHVYLGAKWEPGAFNNHATNWKSAVDVDTLTGLTTIGQGATIQNTLNASNIVYGYGNPNMYGGAGNSLTTNVDGTMWVDGSQLSPFSVLSITKAIIADGSGNVSVDIAGNGTGIGYAHGGLELFAGGSGAVTIYNSPSQLRMEGSGSGIFFNGLGGVIGTASGNSDNPLIYSSSISNNTVIATASITVTNAPTFNHTNTAPVNTATPALWIDVTNNGSVYKMPLYQ